MHIILTLANEIWNIWIYLGSQVSEDTLKIGRPANSINNISWWY